MLILVEPKVLFFLERPTRLKGLGIWCILVCILALIHHTFFPLEDKAKAKNSAIEAMNNSTNVYPPIPSKPDTTSERTIYYLGKKPKRK
jgi:hypothetical protein